jgi:hypothetical protein
LRRTILKIMEEPMQPDRIAGAGRGALVLAMAGAGWLGWGLGAAHAYNAIVAPIFGVATIFLWAWALSTMRAGRALRRRRPASLYADSKFPARSFAVVVLVEVLGIISVIWLAANRAHRPDLAIDGCALVIGLHYLPLAKIFRAPMLLVLGALISSWCLVSWALFRLNALVIAATIGTGILMWAAAVAVLLRVRFPEGFGLLTPLTRTKRG